MLRRVLTGHDQVIHGGQFGGALNQYFSGEEPDDGVLRHYQQVSSLGSGEGGRDKRRQVSKLLQIIMRQELIT